MLHHAQWWSARMVTSKVNQTIAAPMDWKSSVWQVVVLAGCTLGTQRLEAVPAESWKGREINGGNPSESDHHIMYPVPMRVEGCPFAMSTPTHLCWVHSGSGRKILENSSMPTVHAILWASKCYCHLNFSLFHRWGNCGTQNKSPCFPKPRRSSFSNHNLYFFMALLLFKFLHIHRLPLQSEF